jgi:hypothetical protein
MVHARSIFVAYDACRIVRSSSPNLKGGRSVQTIVGHCGSSAAHTRIASQIVDGLVATQFNGRWRAKWAGTVAKVLG